MRINKRKILLLLLSVIMLINVGFAQSGEELTPVIQEEIDYVRVKIGKTYTPFESVNLTTNMGFILTDKSGLNEDRFIPESKLSLKVATGKIKEVDILNQYGISLYTLPANGSFILSPINPNDTIGVNNRHYRGGIMFFIGKEGLNIINYLDMEKYLYGVVPREIPALSREDALKAQAVAARSYAYRSLNKYNSEGYDLCDTTTSQVYGGFSAEHANTNRAVDATKKEVLMYGNEIANTVYHSSSGGVTESSQRAWGGVVPYLVSIDDPFSLNVVNSNWKVELTKSELENTLLRNGINVGELIDIVIINKSESNRVLDMDIVGSLGSRRIKGSLFRSMFGNTIIKSTLFELDFIKEEIKPSFPIIVSENITHVTTGNNTFLVVIDEDRVSVPNKIEKIEIKEPNSNVSKVIVSGKGYGHGVGMSQYGAMEMAKLGMTYDAILSHYYMGTSIVKR